MSLVVVDTAGASAVTVICEISTPTAKRRSTLASSPTTRWIPLRMASWKPALVTLISYSPSGSDRTRYRPASSVTLFRTAPVGTGAPEGSVTVPLMLADTWARAEGKQPNIRRTRASEARQRRVQLHRLAQRKGLTRESCPIANNSFLFICNPPKMQKTARKSPHRPLADRSPDGEPIIQYSSYRYVKPT